MSLCLCLIRHPLKSVDMLAERNLEILNHLCHTRLVAFREILLHIHLSDSIRKESVRHGHRTLPTWTHLLLAGHLTAEEIEMRSIKLIAHVTCCTCDHACCKICLHCFDILAIIQSDNSLDHLRLTYHNLIELTDSHLAEIHTPVEIRILCKEFSLCHRCIVCGHITKLNIAAERLRHLGLEGKNLLCSCGSILPTDHSERLGKPLHIAIAKCLILGIKVIVAVAHSKSGLINVEHIHRTVKKVCTYACAEHRVA